MSNSTDCAQLMRHASGSQSGVMAKAYYEFTDKTSSKFWEIEAPNLGPPLIVLLRCE